MRKILPILFVAAVFLTPLYPVYAQAPAAPTARIAKPPTASAGAAVKPPVINKLENKVQKIEDKVATRSAALKAKLLKFRDQVKAKRVENINSNLDAINKRRTTDMQNNLTRLSDIVSKLKTWMATQQAAGKDTAAIQKAITDTEAVWTQADAAVKAQTGNDYTIVVGSESTVRTDAQTTRNSLQADLKSVHDKIVLVRQTLAGALSSLGGSN